MENLKLGSLNLCLGLPNKKDIVTDLLNRNSISICSLQETEVPMNFRENILSFGGYNLELKLNTVKKHCGVYLKNDIKYVRRNDLEK